MLVEAVGGLQEGRVEVIEELGLDALRAHVIAYARALECTLRVYAVSAQAVTQVGAFEQSKTKELRNSVTGMRPIRLASRTHWKRSHTSEYEYESGE